MFSFVNIYLSEETAANPDGLMATALHKLVYLFKIGDKVKNSAKAKAPMACVQSAKEFYTAKDGDKVFQALDHTLPANYFMIDNVRFIAMQKSSA